MTTEELNMAVFDKMSDELQTYANHLKTLSPEEILNQCREYVTKFDILSVMETTDLPADQARALLAAPFPLDTVYLHYDTKEMNYLDGIRDAIEEKAAQLLTEQESLAGKPLYTHSISHAKASGTMDEYIVSHRLNIACKEEIESAIRDYYHNNHLDEEAARMVVEKYGIPRTMFVLANTIQSKSWDKRFSSVNRSWADSASIPPDKDRMGNDRRQDYVVNSHPGLTDIFTNCVRRIYLQPEKQTQRVKPSVRDRIKTPPPRKNSPNYSANKSHKER